MPITGDFDVFVQRYKGTNMEKVNCQKRRMDLKKEDLDESC